MWDAKNITWPKPTNMWLMSPYKSFGSHDWRFSLSSKNLVICSICIINARTYRVCSGVFVGGLCHPRRLVIRWTWTSTPIPSCLNKRSFKTHRDLKESTDLSHAIWRARKAIFGPTPGNEHSSSTVSGTSELKLSLRSIADRFRYLG